MIAAHRLTAKEQDLLDAFVNRLGEKCGAALKKVILYGSPAGRDATEESDDVFPVVVSQVKDFWRSLDEIGKMAHELLLTHGPLISEIRLLRLNSNSGTRLLCS